MILVSGSLLIIEKMKVLIIFVIFVYFVFSCEECDYFFSNYVICIGEMVCVCVGWMLDVRYYNRYSY